MKIGDYIRTEFGVICKISEFRGNLVLTDDAHFFTYIDNNDIKKVSQNIIDLIEKSDLVVDNYGNIYVVDYVFDNYIYTTTKQGNIIKTLCDYQIKSIVTKEMFERMEYKVVE